MKVESLRRSSRKLIEGRSQVFLVNKRNNITDTNDKVEAHLSAAKDEVTSAASEIAEDIKEKVLDAADAVADKVHDAAEKIHDAAHKGESATK